MAECARCPSEERLEDGRCEGCSVRRAEQANGEGFAGWVNELERVSYWIDAGFDPNRLNLAWHDWEALSLIIRHRRAQDEVAVARLMHGESR